MRIPLCVMAHLGYKILCRGLVCLAAAKGCVLTGSQYARSLGQVIDGQIGIDLLYLLVGMLCSSYISHLSSDSGKHFVIKFCFKLGTTKNINIFLPGTGTFQCLFFEEKKFWCCWYNCLFKYQSSAIRIPIHS